MSKPIEVGLFLTCLVDTFRPNVGFASLKLLEDAGCKVHIPIGQTCCGQTAWNLNDIEDAQSMAIDVIKHFEQYDYIVAPSQNCTTMLRDHYTVLFAKDPTWKTRVEAFSKKVFEITDFLKTVMHLDFDSETKTDLVIGKDLAPLLDIASKLKKQGSEKQVRHITEVMADMLETPSIGRGS